MLFENLQSFTPSKEYINIYHKKLQKTTICSKWCRNLSALREIQQGDFPLDI